MNSTGLYVKGPVQYGRQQASFLGFNTLNIHIPPHLLSTGVFYGTAFINEQTYQSVIYVGATRERDNGAGDEYQCVEAHLLNTNDVTYYGYVCVLHILGKIRSDKIFTNIEDLKKQIKIDILMCVQEFDDTYEKYKILYAD